MHWALEDFHGHNIYGSPDRAFWAYYLASQEARVLPDTGSELILVGIGMMRYYSDIWLGSRGRPHLKTFVVEGHPMCELRFEIPLPIEDKQGRQVIYRGTLDRVIEDEYNRLWVGEYKSAKAFRLHHFDTDDQITAYCTPISTEILTRQGWKTYDQLIIGEEVLGYNKDTEQMEWTALEDIHYFKDRKTVKLSNKSFEFECTPDHRWVQVNENNKGPKEGKGKVELKPIKAGTQHHKVLLSAPYTLGSSGITPDEAAVIAWLLTDGSFGDYKKGAGIQASICQSRTEYTVEVKDLLDRFEGAYSRISDRSGCNIYHLTIPFFKQLWAKTGLTIDLQGWEQFLLGLSQEAIQAFCKAAVMAEGNANGQFYQNRGIKQDIFKMAFFLSGKFPSKGFPSGKGGNGFANQGICEAFTPGTPEKWVRTIKSEDVEGVKDVWCPQTGTRTWVMRQEGQIAITGNCWALQSLFPDREVAGVCYQQHRKVFPEPPKILKTGKVSVAANMTTNYYLYRKVCADLYGDWDNFPPENKAYLNRLATEESDDADNFIRRDWIYRNKHQIAAQGEKILMEAEDMLREDLPLYPNPNKDCSWSCPLEAACVAMDDGSDWESILKSFTVNRDSESYIELEQDKWRNHLPNPQQMPPLPDSLNLKELEDLTELQDSPSELQVLLGLE